MIQVEEVEKQLRHFFPEHILGGVIEESGVPKKLRFVMYGHFLQEVWYIFVHSAEIELRIVFGEIDVNECHEMVDNLGSVFGTGIKITISCGTMRKRSNVICSSSRKDWNKKTQNATDMFKPKYNLTSSIARMLISIAKSKEVIENAKILPEREIELRLQALLKTAHSSTAIEGNQLNINEVKALWADKKVDVPQREKREIDEVRNYLNVLRYIEKIGDEKQSITQKVLLHIHKLITDKILPEEQCGKYRKKPIYVVKRIPGFPAQVIYTGPEAKKVPDLCKNLLEWIDKSEKKEINPIIVAGIVHQEIAAIHPFIDGNGRTARVLATLVLYKRDYDFRRFFCLEDYYNNDRPEYYKAINIGENYEERKIDFTTWLEYFIKGFKEEINSLKRNLKK